VKRWAIVMLVLAAGVLLPWGRVGSGQDAGAPLYPDLEARPPADLYLATEVLGDGQPHHLLRFATTAVNVGEGRLEMEGDAEPPADPGRSSPVYQNLYDGPIGGEVVARAQLGADLVYHPTHFHFHLDEFASYRLLQRPEGVDDYRPTAYDGAKTSSCLLDSERVGDDGPESAEYAGCEGDRQGISVGWADVYDASLPDQWVDLGVADGSAPLPDGDYAVEFVVDPADRVDEGGREDNNRAETTFTVRDGRIADHPAPPRCALDDPNTAVGATVTLTCAGFAPEERIEVHWQRRDVYERDPPPPLAVMDADEEGGGAVAVPIPEAAFGGHNLVITGAEGRTTVAIVGIAPSLTVAPTGHGLGVTTALSGFGDGETVVLAWEGPDGTAVPVGQITVSALGSAEMTLRNRAVGGETPTLRATGQGSGASAVATIDASARGAD